MVQMFTELSRALDRNKFDAAVLMVPHHLHPDMQSGACLPENTSS